MSPHDRPRLVTGGGRLAGTAPRKLFGRGGRGDSNSSRRLGCGIGGRSRGFAWNYGGAAQPATRQWNIGSMKLPDGFAISCKQMAMPIGDLFRLRSLRRQTELDPPPSSALHLATEIPLEVAEQATEAGACFMLARQG